MKGEADEEEKNPGMALKPLSPLSLSLSLSPSLLPSLPACVSVDLGAEIQLARAFYDMASSQLSSHSSRIFQESEMVVFHT